MPVNQCVKPILFFAITVFMLLFIHSAHASTFYVTSTVDAVDTAPGDGNCMSSFGDCTLRAAIMEANSTVRRDRIFLSAGTYNLDLAGSGEDGSLTGDLDILNSLTIAPCRLTDKKQCEHGDVIINGLGQDRVFHTIGPINVRLVNITVTNGQETLGGAIFNGEGNLVLKSVEVSDSTADQSGGGIYNDGGTLSALSSLITRNTSLATGVFFSGAGIYSINGTLLVNASEISNSTAEGHGGGICADNNDVTIQDDSLITNNSSNRDGGSIYAVGSTLLVDHSEISNSTAEYGGGIRAEYSDVTIQNDSLITNSSADGGFISSSGGGISISESTTLLVDHSEISYCTAGSNGGGIHIGYNSQTIIQNNSLITHNLASSFGGGLATGGSGYLDSLLINDSEVSYNSAGLDGGGIYHVHTPTDVSITGSLFKYNTADSDGGAITISSVINLTIDSSIFENNSAGDSGGALDLSDIVFTNLSKIQVVNNSAGIDGGGMSIVVDDDSTVIPPDGVELLSLRDSTIANNTAVDEGGGIYIKEHATHSPYLLMNFANSTISGNTADSHGGGVFADIYYHSLYFANMTITQNTAAIDGGGIHKEETYSEMGWYFKNSIIAENVAGNEGQDCFATDDDIFSDGYNLIGDTHDCDYSAGIGDILGDSEGAGVISPLLNALTDNGGSTLTHLPQAGSPVIDAGDPLGCTDYTGATLLYDQRGVGYDRVKDGNGDLTLVCDMGATEL